jgi:hypothetical protein
VTNTSARGFSDEALFRDACAGDEALVTSLGQQKSKNRPKNQENERLMYPRGRTLGLSGCFVLRKELARSDLPLDAILKQLQTDSYYQHDVAQDSEHWKSWTGSVIKMDVVSYCVYAMRFLHGLTESRIQDIGFEIALVGRQGFDTTSAEKRYRFAGVPQKVFSGLEAVVWMYCLWQIIDPNVDLGVDFGREYGMAKQTLSRK